jgi:trigger factor
MRTGEQKIFTLKFPKDNFNKMLAGKDVEFTVDLKGVHEIDHPALDEVFAKRLGQESMEKLRERLRQNLEDEARTKENQRQEVAAIEELVKRSEVGEIPDLLVTNETRKMLHELEHSVAQQGREFGEYLKSLKKTQDALLLDFAPEALKRVKATVLMREIAKRENLEPTDQELLDEQLKLLSMYADDPETQARIREDEGMAYLRGMLKNRKVLSFLRENAIHQ